LYFSYILTKIPKQTINSSKFNNFDIDIDDTKSKQYDTGYVKSQQIASKNWSQIVLVTIITGIMFGEENLKYKYLNYFFFFLSS